jgi:hypothetical protein
VEAVARGILSSIQDFYQTVGGQLANQMENDNPQNKIQPPATVKHTTQETTTICLNRLQFVKQRIKIKIKMERVGL